MPTIQVLLHDFMKKHDLNAAQISKQTKIGYPTLLSLLKDGGAPRKLEHREAIRKLLQVDTKVWVSALGKSIGLDIPPDDGSQGQDTLSTLVARAMLDANMNEHSLAERCHVPFATIANIIRKNAVPRRPVLEVLAKELNIPMKRVWAVVDCTRLTRAVHQSSGPVSITSQNAAKCQIAKKSIPLQDQGLAQVVVHHIAQRGLTIAGFARTLGASYLEVSRFLSSGKAPEDASLLERIQAELQLDERSFSCALKNSQEQPQAASLEEDAQEIPADANPLQAEILRFMQDHKLTMASIAKKTSLSMVTLNRVIRQGILPSRESTHTALCILLGIDRVVYDNLLCQEYITGAVKRQNGPKPAKRSTRQYQPSTTDRERPIETHAALSANGLDAGLVAMLRSLDPKQIASVKNFVQTKVALPASATPEG